MKLHNKYSVAVIFFCVFAIFWGCAKEVPNSRVTSNSGIYDEATDDSLDTHPDAITAAPELLAVPAPVVDAEQPSPMAAPDEVHASSDHSVQDLVEEQTVALDNSSERLGDYKVELGGDSHLTFPSNSGQLIVWIGDAEYSATFPDDFNIATSTIPALGESATVKPYAPDFEVIPAETACIKIHRRGSSVRFELRPIKGGHFKVGADVNLFGSDDCTGIAVPQAATSLAVDVEVSWWAWLMLKVKVLGDIAWTQFVDFWAEAVAILFALMLFLLRGKLLSKFGFGSK
ncbi:MAG: hypothetical protein P1U47_06355 [Zhongshania sp.]|uniref:hypothetical protein n=1 Tax=Zhongshania sp. TaxID=1971902 RepID=UPI002624E1D2|nr:hypothetical protein [Zhongshania sp.]MDF1691973.1 hypothetical protein [Zhongshania sp.]